MAELRLLTPPRVAFVVFVVLFGVYVATMAPSFGFADRGELAAVASTLGVAHPTGYPTITLLGKLATLVAPGRDIVALNALSALLTAAGGAVLVLLFAALVRLAAPAETAPPRGVTSALAGLAALLVGLTATWWEQGTSFEVFSLHVLMMPLVTWLFVRFTDDAVRTSRVGFTARGFAFALVLGLSFTNHLTMLLLAPSLLIWYFWRLGMNTAAVRRLLYLVPPFLLGLAPYVYLPVRAAAEPWFNWGDPETWWALWRHVSGAQFQGWMFTNPATFGPHTTYALGNLSRELVVVGLGLAVLGVVYLAPRRLDYPPRVRAGARARRKGFLWTVGASVAAAVGYLYLASAGDGPAAAQRLDGLIFGFVLLMVVFVAAAVGFAGRAGAARCGVCVVAVLAVLVCLFYAGGYDIVVELRPYYLTAFFAIGILLVFGLVWLVERFGATRALAAGAVVVLAAAVVNVPAADERDHTLVEDMAVNMLTTLPQDAVVLSKQWSFWVAGSYYLQRVEQMRPDVLVIDYELLRRSWYLDQLAANHPDLMAGVREEVEAFRAEVDKFEHDQPYDPQRIEAAYVDLIDAMVRTSMEHRPVFVTPEFDSDAPAGQDGRPYYAGDWDRVPVHLAYRLTDDDGYIEQEFPSYRFQFASGPPDWHVLAQYWWYAQSCLARAEYEREHGNDALADRYLDYARSFDPQVTMDDLATEPLSRPQAEHILESFQRLAEQGHGPPDSPGVQGDS